MDLYVVHCLLEKVSGVLGSPSCPSLLVIGNKTLEATGGP